MSATPTLKAICDTCHEPVGDGDGSLYVDMREVTDARQSWTEHNKQVAADYAAGRLPAEDLADLLTLEDPARWRVQHTSCDTAPDADCYWTAQLLEKDWLQHTDWNDLLRTAALGDESRITPINRPSPGELG